MKSIGRDQPRARYSPGTGQVQARFKIHIYIQVRYRPGAGQVVVRYRPGTGQVQARFKIHIYI
jgi:hypothetical protein